MSQTHVLFIQGGGEGAHAADAALADSLKKALGPNYTVRFPRMPGEASPQFAAWKRKLASELSHGRGDLVLVGHSLGGAMLLNYLAEESETLRNMPVAGLFLLAVPAWDGKKWQFDELKLPADIADKLADIPQIFLYHCRDDKVVPFEHLALHAAQLPDAIVREIDHGGHQFDKDLSEVAEDIRDGDDAVGLL